MIGEWGRGLLCEGSSKFDFIVNSERYLPFSLQKRRVIETIKVMQ